MTLVQANVIDAKGRAGKPCVQLQERLERTGVAAKAGKRDMRMVCASIRSDPDPPTGLIHLLVERGQVGLRRYARPKHSLTALLEHANAVDANIEWHMSNAEERDSQVFGLVTVECSDESHGEVQLLLALPTCAWDAAHDVQQLRSNWFGGTDADKQAMHGIDAISLS
jgi:hypothetical protein